MLPREAPLLPGNDLFCRGDRVVVQADPHQFREMQMERYGGWNDEMALVRSTIIIIVGIIVIPNVRRQKILTFKMCFSLKLNFITFKTFRG